MIVLLLSGIVENNRFYWGLIQPFPCKKEKEVVEE
jgi:hypothetical protein